jgi:hypothetical protein
MIVASTSPPNGRDRELDGKLGSTRTQSGDLDGPIDQRSVPGGEEAVDPGGVGRAEALGDDQLGHWPPERHLARDVE